MARLRSSACGSASNGSTRSFQNFRKKETEVGVIEVNSELSTARSVCQREFKR